MGTGLGGLGCQPKMQRNSLKSSAAKDGDKEAEAESSRDYDQGLAPCGRGGV